MAATVLRRGSRGDDVRRLQEALNRKLPGAALRVDGDFGNGTHAAVRRFQEAAWLVVDGVAGQCTQNALFDAESYTPIRHQRPFIPQPTDNTCWAASTAMLKRSTVAAVIAATPADLIAGGGLSNSSDRADWETGTRRFAQAHNLRYFAPQSWTPQGFVSLVRNGPVMVSTLWNVGGYLRRIPGGYEGSPGHMTLVVGARGDGDPSGRGTSLMIHDPWEPNVGRRWRVSYYNWVTEVITRTYRLFQQ